MAFKAAVGMAALAVGVSRAGMMPPQVTSMVAEVADQYVPLAFDAFERNQVPDIFTRFGIRKLLEARLEDERQPDNFAQQARLQAFVDELKASPIAVNTGDANEQHYEVPAKFYELVLGKYAKYSSALYPEGTTANQASDLLDEAGDAMLALYAQRSGIDKIDGPFRLLDMGCGWGSVALWFAEHYPKATVRGVSNSNSQREWIMARAQERGLTNLKIYTGNIVEWELPEGEEQFDRVISIEMLEHMKNYEKLFGKLSTWLKPEGYFFTHIFTHKEYAYHFEAKEGANDSDWMTRYFFSGGTMPSAHLLHYFQRDLNLMNHWQVNGAHYGLTSEAWLQNMDKNEEALLPILGDIYGKGEEVKWFARWRGFFLACAECFFYDNGNEWFVSHYLFQKPA